MSNNPKPGYKLSEIGEIPEDWEVVRLGDVLALCDNGTWGENDATPETGYPILRSTNIKNGKVINLSEVAYRRVLKNRVEKYKLLPGDIIVTRSSGSPHLVGDIAYFDVDKEGSQVFLFSNYTQRLRVEKDKIKSKFLCYYLLSPIAKNILKKISDTTTGLKNLNIKTYKSQPIPLPPLPEQHKTASILSTVDETVQKTDEVIKKTQELKKGLMQQLLTKGISHTKFKQTEIGEIPEEWKAVEFNECFRRRKIEVGNVSKQNYKKCGLYSIIDQGANFIAGYTDDESKVYQGDLPVIIFGDHTRFFKYVDFPFVTGADGTKILPPNRALFDPEYLYYALLNLRIENLGYNRHFKLLKEKVLPLPPLPEQQKIAGILSGVDEKIEVERKRKEKLEELKKGLMQDLLTGKIRVKLVGADPCVCPQ